jgi:hypothetical protein
MEARPFRKAVVRPAVKGWGGGWLRTGGEDDRSTQTESLFPLRWRIINSIVFAYIGSTRLQGRIAVGYSSPCEKDNICNFIEL